MSAWCQRCFEAQISKSMCFAFLDISWSWVCSLFRLQNIKRSMVLRASYNDFCYTAYITLHFILSKYQEHVLEAAVEDYGSGLQNIEGLSDMIF